VNVDSPACSLAAALLGTATMKIFLTLLATVTLLGAAAAPANAAYYYHGHRYAYRYHGHYYRYHYHSRYYNYRTCHVSAGRTVCTYR